MKTVTHSVKGRDLVAALTVGGFKVARRERGLVLLVRRLDAVVVREDRLLDAERVSALIERAHITEDELATWLGIAASPLPTANASKSGFHRRADTDRPNAVRTGVERSVDEVLRGARDASARAGALHEGMSAVLKASSAALDEARTLAMPDEERARATRIALERWHEAMRERALDDSVEDRHGRKA